MDYVRKRLKTVYQQILNCDLLYASSQHVEDRLWRYIFYPPIEETRSRLRKLKSSDPSTVWQNLITIYHHYIDSSFKFYRDLNHNIKTVYHVDTKTIGIDVFRHQATTSSITDEDKVAILLQSNYICMGDLARYRASFPSTDKDSPKDDNNNSNSLSSTANAWKISKTCYQKAVDVYRSSGKPYSQLALVSASTGSVIDVVWYYSMSLAMKQPSSLGFANLKSFYSKVRFTFSKPLTSDASGLADQMKAPDCISHFVESFLQMHHAIVFQKNDSFPPISHGLGLAMTQTITALMTESGLDLTLMKNVSSIFHIVRSTLTRTITILLVSVWYMGEFMKAKANASHQPELQHLQMLLLDYGFDVLTNLFKTTTSILEQLNKEDATHDGSESIHSLSAMVDNTILPGLSIWCAYLYTNMDVIAQYCHGADGRHTAPLNGKSKDATKRSLVRSIQTFCSCLIGHPSFPLPVNNVLPSSYPLSEDVLLLGLVPLRSFHSSVDFFKETAYEVDEQTTADARQQVRWCRAREFIRKIAESQSFNFVQYNQAEQNYSVIDENAKRQQQSRFMKALATQRLMEQVSSLEKNVNKMNVSPKTGEKSSSKLETTAPEQVDVYVVIVDVTAFLDGLAKVKKWANQTLNVRRRVQSSILQVVVPLDVIDVLDLYKKGDSHMNLQARESIRYLDHQLSLADNNNNTTDDDNSNNKKPPARSFLRTQKVGENLADWDQASSFWIDHVHQDETNTMDHQTALTDSDDVDDASISSGDDLFKSHGRRRGRRFIQHGSDSDTDDTASEEDYTTEEDDDDDDDNDSESGDDDNHASDVDQQEEEEDDQVLSYTDVPKTYRPILHCLLHFYQKQPTSTNDQVEHLVLVTNDEDLTAWAQRFGDPSSGKSLAVYTVHEWDRILNTRTFEMTTNTSGRPK
ncbi:unnamed protein product [Absidia cylindrospora]